MNNNIKSSFISGYFNVIHTGHYRLFSYAKKFTSKLIVAIYEGEHNEQRLEMVKNCKYVDKVYLINKSKLLNILNKIKPTYIIKGNEFSKKKNIEQKFILRNKTSKIIFTSGQIENENLFSYEPSLLSLKHDYEYLDRNKISKESLLNIVSRFKNLNVCIIGEIIEDIYSNFDALGLSKEDPVIVYGNEKSKRYIGGAGIVSCHSANLGAKSYLVTCYNKNKDNFISNILKKNNVNSLMINDITRRNIKKIRFRSNDKTFFKINDFNSHSIDKSIEKILVQSFEKISNKIDLLIYSDFNYGLISKNLIKQLNKIAKKNKILIAADSQISSQFGNLLRYQNIDYFSQTEFEIRDTLKNKEDGLVEIMNIFQKTTKCKFLNMKLGSNGTVFNNYYRKFYTDRVSALNLSPKDVSGAGDSFLVGSSMALTLGASFKEAIYIGSLLSSIQISREGNVPILYDELVSIINII